MTTRKPPRVLTRAFYRRATLDVARDLIGRVLVRLAPAGISAGVIVETEAYIGESDPACHASSGKTPRNEPMYGQPGHAYVYFTYGCHYLVNVVTEPAGTPAAVLIRALEPVDGLDLMRRRRGVRRGGREVPARDLCRGPGNLTKAMGIGLTENRADLTSPGSGDSRLWIEDRGIRPGPIAWSSRIGIRVGTEHQWRCLVADHPCVSRG